EFVARDGVRRMVMRGRELDGWLRVDTDVIETDELAQWLGGELSDSARRRMVGSSLARSIAIMHHDLGVDADPESSGAFLTGRTAELFRTALVWKPGAQELLIAVGE